MFKKRKEGKREGRKRIARRPVTSWFCNKRTQMLTQEEICLLSVNCRGWLIYLHPHSLPDIFCVHSFSCPAGTLFPIYSSIKPPTVCLPAQFHSAVTTCSICLCHTCSQTSVRLYAPSLLTCHVQDKPQKHVVKQVRKVVRKWLHVGTKLGEDAAVINTFGRIMQR